MAASRDGLLRALGAKRLDAEILEEQTAGLVDFKIGQLEVAGPEIHRQK